MVLSAIANPVKYVLKVNSPPGVRSITPLYLITVHGLLSLPPLIVLKSG